MALTQQQLNDFRADIGDNNIPPAFKDPELQRLYERAGNDYERAILLAFDQLLADSAKLSDYTQNASAEKQSQVFDHLMKVREAWQANRVQQGRQVRMVGMRSVPSRIKDKPHTEID